MSGWTRIRWLLRPVRVNRLSCGTSARMFTGLRRWFRIVTRGDTFDISDRASEQWLIPYPYQMCDCGRVLSVDTWSPWILIVLIPGLAGCKSATRVWVWQSPVPLFSPQPPSFPWQGSSLLLSPSFSFFSFLFPTFLSLWQARHHSLPSHTRVRYLPFIRCYGRKLVPTRVPHPTEAGF